MDSTTDERATRLECLRLAIAENAAGQPPHAVVKAAQQYFDFVQGVDAKPAAG